MTTDTLLQDIKTLSPVQLKPPNNLYTYPDEKETVESFVNEKEATDFANYYSGIILNETR
jgi:hypothetical protein